MLAHIHGGAFQQELGAYKQAGRLLSLSDLLDHLRAQVGGMTPQPGAVAANLTPPPAPVATPSTGHASGETGPDEEEA